MVVEERVRREEIRVRGELEGEKEVKVVEVMERVEEKAERKDGWDVTIVSDVICIDAYIFTLTLH
jgi:hypothetical protein